MFLQANCILCFGVTVQLISLSGAVYDPDVELEQIDLAPTLSLLLGLPVPQNSLGTLIIDVFSGLTIRQKLSATYINAQQLLQVLENNVKNHKQGWFVWIMDMSVLLCCSGVENLTYWLVLLYRSMLDYHTSCNFT